MEDASCELAAAVVARLKADASVASFVGGRVYDRVPEDPAPAPPYLSLGPSDATTDDADCIDGVEITMQIDCWSWGSGDAYSSKQVRKLSGAVRKALHEVEFELDDNALVNIRHRITRFQRDGEINRAIITITASVELP